MITERTDRAQLGREHVRGADGDVIRPRGFWAPRSWGINHPLYVRAQIAHGLDEVGYGYWGFSPAASPRGGYEVYGVKALGTCSAGYFSYEGGPPVKPPLMPHSTRSAHGIVTPHASFLALRYAPHEAVANLRALSGGLPIYGPLGFQDSVDVSVGVTSGRILALDQGMIMAAIANELTDNAMQHAFSDGRVEQVVRPLIAVEQFSAGMSGQLIEAQPTVVDSQERWQKAHSVHEHRNLKDGPYGNDRLNCSSIAPIVSLACKPFIDRGPAPDQDATEILPRDSALMSGVPPPGRRRWGLPRCGSYC